MDNNQRNIPWWYDLYTEAIEQYNNGIPFLYRQTRNIEDGMDYRWLYGQKNNENQAISWFSRKVFDQNPIFIPVYSR